MNTFLKTYRLALTPLSPIHIGCGEDFEPTNYVIDEGVLYGFDPSRAVLNELQRKELATAVSSNSLLVIQRFFRKYARTFMPHADVLIPVASGVKKQYMDRVGKVANHEGNGADVFNKLALERTMYTGRLSQPYIPGSSFKGAIRTAILDDLNHRNKPREDCSKTSSELEKRLLQGDFGTSPLRLLKVADLMPVSEPQRKVLFAVNRKKKPVLGRDGSEAQPKGVAARKECILQGQYRIFTADAVLQSLNPHQDSRTTPVQALRPDDLRAIAKQSNAYHQTRLRRELSVLDGQGLVNPDWKNSLTLLMSGVLGQRLANGDAFLIRLGRYGGAECKTLSGEGVASIKIMGAQGQPATFETSTKTVWLAAEFETDQKHLLPFGWAVVEINPQADLPELKTWCEAQSQGRPDMTKLAAQAAQGEAKRLAAAQREQELANMSAQDRQIEDLREKCDDWVQKMPPNGKYGKQLYKAGSQGSLYQEAAKLVTQATTNTDWSAANKTALADMLEQWLPKVTDPWNATEQHTKLKLATLRGTT